VRRLPRPVSHRWRLLSLTALTCNSGYNIGTRLVDEFFAKTGTVRDTHAAVFSVRESKPRCVEAHSESLLHGRAAALTSGTRATRCPKSRSACSWVLPPQPQTGRQTAPRARWCSVTTH